MSKIRSSEEEIQFILRAANRLNVHEGNQYKPIAEMLLVLAKQLDRIEEKLNATNQN